MSTYELTVYVLTKWLRQMPEGTGQLKADIRDAASDSNTTSSYGGSETPNQSQAVTFKESHSQ